MRIIAISGKAQHGKDTTAGFLAKQLQEEGKSVLIYHYADLLKHFCRSYFGWSGAKDDAGRKVLQYIGTDVVRKKDPDFWVDVSKRLFSLFPTEWDYILIPDCRFPNEVAGSDIHLRVVRGNFPSPLTEEQQRHESETALDDCLADIWLHNDGSLEELEEKIKQIAQEVSE